MKRAFVYAAAICLCGPAVAAPPRNPPLPPPRPKLEAPVVPTPPPAPEQTAGACAALQDARVLGVSLPAIPGENGCGIADPVRINGIRLRNGATLKLTPDAVLNCDMAGKVADFLDEEVARLEESGAGKIVEVQHAGAYECRSTNHVPGAKLSEHAKGNAIDLRVFKFSDGHTMTIGADHTPTWAGVKGAACARFKTVLGPGSDPEHKDHLHLDMRTRKSATICQWVLD